MAVDDKMVAKPPLSKQKQFCWKWLRNSMQYALDSVQYAENIAPLL